MRLLTVTVDNFKRIGHVALDAADRTMILVGGKNGAGKSSLLDAISAALMGEKASPEEPIRRGESTGSVTVQLEGYTVVRTWTRKQDGTAGSSLKITGPDGGIGSPQTWLAGKMGDLTCDPLAFMGLDSKKQAERLRKLVGLDTTALDQREANLRDARLQIGRDGDREGGALAKMGKPADAPAVPVVPTYRHADVVEAELVEAAQTSPASILEEIAAAEATERAAEAAAAALQIAARNCTGAADRLGTIHARIERLRAELAAAESELAGEEEIAGKLAAARVAASDALDVARAAVVPSAPHRSRLAGVEAENKAARDAAAVQNAAARAKAAEANAQAQREAAAANEAARQAADVANAKMRAMEAYKEQEARVVGLRADYKAKTAEIEAVAAERAAMLAAAKFPVEGLSFADGGVTFNGLPLLQASGAERIRVSMGIALAANPKIKLVLIRDASLLDEDSLAMVAEMAESAGAQVILERVGSGDPDAIIIVDGGTV